MKKYIALLLSLLLFCSCLVTPAAAAELKTDEQIAVETAEGMFFVRASKEEQNLGTNKHVDVSIKNVLPNQVRVTQYVYRTNSTNLYVKLKSDIETSIRVKVINYSTGVTFATAVLHVDPDSYATTTFGTFSYLDTYYLTFENTGIQTVNLSGYISACPM